MHSFQLLRGERRRRDLSFFLSWNWMDNKPRAHSIVPFFFGIKQFCRKKGEGKLSSIGLLYFKLVCHSPIFSLHRLLLVFCPLSLFFYCVPNQKRRGADKYRQQLLLTSVQKLGRKECMHSSIGVVIKYIHKRAWKRQTSSISIEIKKGHQIRMVTTLFSDLLILFITPLDGKISYLVTYRKRLIRNSILNS